MIGNWPIDIKFNLTKLPANSNNFNWKLDSLRNVCIAFTFSNKSIASHSFDWFFGTKTKKQKISSSNSIQTVDKCVSVSFDEIKRYSLSIKTSCLAVVNEISTRFHWWTSKINAAKKKNRVNPTLPSNQTILVDSIKINGILFIWNLGNKTKNNQKKQNKCQHS